LAFVAVCTKRNGSESLALMLLALPIAAHLFMGIFSGIETAIHQRSAGALLLPPVILGFHLAYGAGTAVGLLDSAVTPCGLNASSWRIVRDPRQD